MKEAEHPRPAGTIMLTSPAKASGKLRGGSGARMMAGLRHHTSSSASSASSVAQATGSSTSGAPAWSQDLSALFSACRHGNHEAVATYLDRCPDLATARDDGVTKGSAGAGNTLLHVACQCGSKRVVKMSLRRGADINARNHAGQTSLHFCFAYGFEALATYLIGKGADDGLRNAEGLTPYEGLSLSALERL